MWNRQKCLVETAGEGNRELNETGYLVKQRLINDGYRLMHPGLLLNLLPDPVTAFVETGNYPTLLLKHAFIVRRLNQCQILIVMETMPPGAMAGPDPEDIRLYGFLSKQNDGPVQRSNEFDS